MGQGNGKVAAPIMGRREWIMLIILSVLWGGSFFFVKVMVDGGLPPFVIVLGRVGIAAVILNIWLLAMRDYMPMTAKTWRDFLILGFLNNVLPFSLIVVGEQRITSGLASILNATAPIFTVIVAHFLTETEKLSSHKVFGVLSGFVGVAVLMGPDALSGLHRADVMGELACIGAAVCYAFAGVFAKRFKGMNPVKVATGQMSASSLMLIPLVLICERPWTLPMPSLAAWGAMVGIAVFSTVIAFVLYFHILAAAGATNVMLVTLLVPVSALLLGWRFLGEAITAQSIIGMAIIGFGLAAIDGRVFKLWAKRRRGGSLR